MSNTVKQNALGKNEGRHSMPVSWLVFACYVIVLALYLTGCALSLIQDNARIKTGAIMQREMSINEFEPISILRLEDEEGKAKIVSTDNDPRLLYYRLEGFYVTHFVFDAVPNHPGGEMVLYYTTSQAQGLDFTEQQKLWGKQAADGSWHFDLGGKKIYALRLDIDTTGGVVWTINRIGMNDKKPALAYFVPSMQPLVVLLLLPGLAAAILAEGRTLLRSWKKGTTKKKRARRI